MHIQLYFDGLFNPPHIFFGEKAEYLPQILKLDRRFGDWAILLATKRVLEVAGSDVDRRIASLLGDVIKKLLGLLLPKRLGYLRVLKGRLQYVQLMQTVFDSDTETKIRSVNSLTIEAPNEPMAADIVVQESERFCLQDVVPAHHPLAVSEDFALSPSIVRLVDDILDFSLPREPFGVKLF